MCATTSGLDVRAVLRPNAWFVALVALIIFLADQGAKFVVVTYIGMANPVHPLPFLDGLLTIIAGVNTGTACGYFPQLGNLFTFAPFVILAIVIYFYRQQRREDWLLSIGTGFIIGGAFGNLVDRLRFGHVIDFIQVGSFPVFNVADAAVSTAVVLLLFWSMREDATKQENADGGAPASAVSWKLVLSFIGLLAVLAVVTFFVCVYVPANFVR